MSDNVGVNIIMWGPSGAGKSYFANFIRHITDGQIYNPDLPS